MDTGSKRCHVYHIKHKGEILLSVICMQWSKKETKSHENLGVSSKKAQQREIKSFVITGLQSKKAQVK